MRLSLLAAAALLAVSLQARADQVFNLSNVTITTAPGGGQAVGTLTGSFTTNNALNTVISYNLTASAAGSFAGYTYNVADSTVTASTLPSQYFRIDSSAVPQDELQLFFVGGLTQAGGTISTAQSYEHEPSGGNRYLSGTVVNAAGVVTAATPEPSSLALLGTGALGLVGAARRRFARS